MGLYSFELFYGTCVLNTQKITKVIHQKHFWKAVEGLTHPTPTKKHVCVKSKAILFDRTKIITKSHIRTIKIIKLHNESNERLFRWKTLILHLVLIKQLRPNCNLFSIPKRAIKSN